MIKSNQEQSEAIKRKDMILYRTTSVNFQGFNSMKLDVRTKSASKKYHLQMTDRERVRERERSIEKM